MIKKRGSAVVEEDVQATLDKEEREYCSEGQGHAKDSNNCHEEIS